MSIVGEKQEILTFYTFQDIIDLAEKYPDHNFRFEETDYSPTNIASWRGDYSLPSIEYAEKSIIGKELAAMIKSDIKNTHDGYKGGEYTYDLSDEPYISAYSRVEEHKIVGYRVSSHFGDEILLITEYDRY